MIRRDNPHSRITEATTSRQIGQKDIPSLNDLYHLMDVNGDGKLTKEEFTNGILGIEHWDITEIEVSRMFDSIDIENRGYITRSEFQKAAHRWRWLRSVANVACASKANKFVVPSDYDYTKPTYENYKGPPGDISLIKIHRIAGVFYGEFAKIREGRDYSFHTNYIESRQAWQDMAIRSCLGRTEAQARPWVVYTCGPMGVGKGHVLSWLSKQGLFPLEYIVHIDPDFFKRIMPEWAGYLAAAAIRESCQCESKELAAGTACHVESGYLQEIAMEAAMSERQNVWVDGSLSDGLWYSKVFDDHRKRFPHYRIAIFSISASEATVRARIAKRSRETGRTIPESEIQRSLQSPEESIQLLAPKTDLVVRIVNETSIILKCVEDHSGNWYRGLHKHFGVISHQHPHFPEWLGPLYFENTSLVGYPFEILRRPRDILSNQISSQVIKSGMLEKKGAIQNWKQRWFVLRPGSLIYCSKSDKSTLKGECLITQSTTIERIACDDVPAPETSGQFPTPKLAKSPSSSFLFSRNLEYTFTIHSVRPDGSPISLTVDAGSHENKNNWIDAIRAEIDNSLKKENVSLGYYKNSHTLIKFAHNATSNSPSLRSYLARDRDFKMIISKMQVVDMEKAGRDLMGMPENTTHYRWIYPTQEINESFLHDIDISDPDIMLLRFGGFVNYDRDGRVIGVRAVTEGHSQHMLMFGHPEFLRAEDVDRLHAGERWMRATSQMMKAHGVKYLTFILPHEELPSRRFPPAFAFLFREPNEPSDPRDRYFSPVTEY